jgi:hypothetical protein
MLRNRDWLELIAKAAEWDLRFVVPEVCVVEAINVVRRKWVDDVRTALAKLKLGEFGLAESQQAMLEVIDTAIGGYADALRTRLTEIGVEVVGVPDSVDWIDVVQRASDRRAPYSEGQKDGFRDTLIWHSARAIAAGDTECEVWLISTNHTDFGGDKSKTDLEACPYPLHPHLIEELQMDGSSGRVSYVRTLGRLVQHLAGTYEALPPEKREALIGHLDRDGFARRLTDSVTQLPLNPAAAALPVRTVEASIQSFTDDSDSLELVDAAMRGGGGWTAQFRQTIEAVVDLTDLTGDTAVIDKTLHVAGRLEAGADGTFRQLVVTSIEASSDDPGRRAWIRSQSNSDVLRSLLAQDFAKSFQVPLASDLLGDYFKSMPSASDQMRDLFKDMPTTDAFKDLRSPLDAFKDLRSPLDAFKDLRSPLDAFKDLRSPLDAFKDLRSPLDAFKNLPSPLDAFKNLRSPLDAFKNLPSPLDAFKDLRSPLDAFKNTAQRNAAQPTTPPSGDEMIDDDEHPSKGTNDEPGDAGESHTD